MSVGSHQTATSVIATVFGSHVGIKGVSSVALVLLERIFVGNELMLLLIFLLYFLDLLFGLLRSIKKRNFDLSKFFMGVNKIIIYGVFILIGISLDEGLHTGTIFTSTIFAFIIITDSISILRNIKGLGYNTPMFLEKHLLSYKDKLDEKFKDK